jgi:hypothetical protein
MSTFILWGREAKATIQPYGMLHVRSTLDNTCTNVTVVLYVGGHANPDRGLEDRSRASDSPLLPHPDDLPFRAGHRDKSSVIRVAAMREDFCADSELEQVLRDRYTA